jgi:type IX secretion system PorP/SprF family membrane protein
MRKLVAIFLLIGTWNFTIFSQDAMFSQINQAPILMNPASTGLMDGWERVGLQHRNQWVGSNGKYNNTIASFDFNLMKSESNDESYIGLGGYFLRDVAGDGTIGRQSAAISLSSIIPMGRSGHTIAAGLQGGFGSTTLNQSSLVFESQWNGSAYDPTVLSGEQLSNHYTFMDVSAGVMYQFDGGSTSFFGKSDVKFQLGAAVYHFNRPTIKFAAGGESILNRKFIFHSLFWKDIPDSDVQYEIDLIQFIQGKQRATYFGGMLKYKLSDGGNYLGGSTQMGVGLHMRAFDALVPSFMLKLKGFRFEVSYDATISALKRTSGGGSLEFSMSYTNFEDALFKQRRKYRY